MDCQTSRVSTGDSLGTICCPEVFIIIFTKSFTILAEFPLGNSTFMAKDGQDTSAGRPRCETSNFAIYAVLTLEADMVMKTTNLGSSQGFCSPVSLQLVLTDFHCQLCRSFGTCAGHLFQLLAGFHRLTQASPS
jgi:hypothetical protein